MLKTCIMVNLCGDWVELTRTDKINGTLYSNWLMMNDLHEYQDDFFGIVHAGVEYLVHKSCLQLKFISAD